MTRRSGRRGIQSRDARLGVGDLCGIREVGLGEQDAIGHRHLPPRLRLPIELHRAVQRVHRGDDAVQPAGIARVRLGQQRMGHRGRVRQARRLDRDAAERRQLASVTALPQHIQRIGDVAAHGAADAAVLQQHGVLDRLLDQQMIQAHRAELVDDDDGIGERRLPQQVVQHRGLAAAQEPGDDCHRHSVRCIAHRVAAFGENSPWRNRKPIISA